jgi:hypothetical protein
MPARAAQIAAMARLARMALVLAKLSLPIKSSQPISLNEAAWRQPPRSNSFHAG